MSSSLVHFLPSASKSRRDAKVDKVQSPKGILRGNIITDNSKSSTKSAVSELGSESTKSLRRMKSVNFLPSVNKARKSIQPIRRTFKRSERKKASAEDEAVKREVAKDAQNKAELNQDALSFLNQYAADQRNDEEEDGYSSSMRRDAPLTSSTSDDASVGTNFSRRKSKLLSFLSADVMPNDKMVLLLTDDLDLSAARSATTSQPPNHYFSENNNFLENTPSKKTAFTLFYSLNSQRDLSISTKTMKADQRNEDQDDWRKESQVSVPREENDDAVSIRGDASNASTSAFIMEVSKELLQIATIQQGTHGLKSSTKSTEPPVGDASAKSSKSGSRVMYDDSATPIVIAANSSATTLLGGVRRQRIDDDDCKSYHSVGTNDSLIAGVVSAPALLPNHSFLKFPNIGKTISVPSINDSSFESSDEMTIGTTLSQISLSQIPCVKESQPIGGPKYYIACITKSGQAKVVYAANRDTSLGAVAEEMGFEVVEYDLAKKEGGEVELQLSSRNDTLCSVEEDRDGSTFADNMYATGATGQTGIDLCTGVNAAAETPGDWSGWVFSCFGVEGIYDDRTKATAPTEETTLTGAAVLTGATTRTLSFPGIFVL